jgi:hypothetical protein
MVEWPVNDTATLSGAARCAIERKRFVGQNLSIFLHGL